MGSHRAANTGLDYASGPAVYALVGMPSMLAAFVKAPLTSILLLFEITRDYNVLIPVMAGVSASMFTQSELTKLLAPAVPAGTPKWLSSNDGAMLEGALTSQVSQSVGLPQSSSRWRARLCPATPSRALARLLT